MEMSNPNKHVQKRKRSIKLRKVYAATETGRAALI